MLSNIIYILKIGIFLQIKQVICKCKTKEMNNFWLTYYIKH